MVNRNATTLQPTWTERGPGVQLVQRPEVCCTTVEELRQAFPELPEQARQSPVLTEELAEAWLLLTGCRDPLVKGPEALEDAIADWAEPPLEGLRRWYQGETISRPPPGTLPGPAWHGDQLAFCTIRFDWGGAHRYAFARRFRLRFGPEGWTEDDEAVKEQASVPLTRTAARAEALFGGPVQGLLRVQRPLQPERLYLAVGRGPGAAPYVWYPERGTAQRYDSWPALQEAHPAAGDPAFLAQLAGELEAYWTDRGVRSARFEPIADGAAYRAEYREQGWGSYTLAYWVDQRATWEFDVPELEQVASPRVEGDSLLAFLQGDKRQPFRMTLDLTGLRLETAPQLVALASERLVSDTGGLHKVPKGESGPAPRSQLVDEELED